VGGNQSKPIQQKPSNNDYKPSLGSMSGGKSSSTMVSANGQIKGQPRQDNFQVGMNGGFFAGGKGIETKDDKKKVAFRLTNRCSKHTMRFSRTR
jgi:hypothetical protein